MGFRYDLDGMIRRGRAADSGVNQATVNITVRDSLGMLEPFPWIYTSFFLFAPAFIFPPNMLARERDFRLIATPSFTSIPRCRHFGSTETHTSTLKLVCQITMWSDAADAEVRSNKAGRDDTLYSPKHAP